MLKLSVTCARVSVADRRFSILIAVVGFISASISDWVD